MCYTANCIPCSALSDRLYILLCATLTEVFQCLSSVVRQMPGYNSKRRGTARTLPKLIVVLCSVCVQMCTVLLPPGVNPTAVNKYIYLSNLAIYILSSVLSSLLCILFCAICVTESLPLVFLVHTGPVQLSTFTVSYLPTLQPVPATLLFPF